MKNTEKPIEPIKIIPSENINLIDKNSKIQQNKLNNVSKQKAPIKELNMPDILSHIGSRNPAQNTSSLDQNSNQAQPKQISAFVLVNSSLPNSNTSNNTSTTTPKNILTKTQESSQIKDSLEQKKIADNSDIKIEKINVGPIKSTSAFYSFFLCLLFLKNFFS